MYYNSKVRGADDITLNYKIKSEYNPYSSTEAHEDEKLTVSTDRKDEETGVLRKKTKLHFMMDIVLNLLISTTLLVPCIHVSFYSLPVLSCIFSSYGLFYFRSSGLMDRLTKRNRRVGGEFICIKLIWNIVYFTVACWIIYCILIGLIPAPVSPLSFQPQTEPKPSKKGKKPKNNSELVPAELAPTELTPTAPKTSDNFEMSARIIFLSTLLIYILSNMISWRSFRRTLNGWNQYVSK